MCMIKLYHYTDEAGWEGIKTSLSISMSPSGAYGPGVYFTDLSPPRYSKGGIFEDIARGTRYGVEVKLPDTKLTCCDKARHIWTFNETVDLECCEHYFLDWPEGQISPSRTRGWVNQKDYRRKQMAY